MAMARTLLHAAFYAEQEYSLRCCPWSARDSIARKSRLASAIAYFPGEDLILCQIMSRAHSMLSPFGWIITVRPVIKRIIILVLFAPSLLVAAAPPERKVENNVIISERDPKVRIELPKSVHYVGADRWVLYDVADCELHAFVDGDDQMRSRSIGSSSKVICRANPT
jgi:hypothetical protein